MADRFVSTSGSNSNTGLSRAQAWRTVQYAVDNASPGDAIYVAAGTYAECVLFTTNGLSETQPTRLLRDPQSTGEALIDRTNAGVNLPGCFSWVTQNGWLVEGLGLVNDARTWAPELATTAAGFVIADGCTDITIRGCYLRDIRKPNELQGSYALPFLVYSNTATSTANVVIDSCEVGNCDTYDAYGEIFHAVVTASGNVQNLHVLGNYLHDEESVGGSGVEISGNQSASASPNRPRDIVVRRNRITGTKLYGVYCTATVDTLVCENTFERCTWGVGAATEVGASYEGNLQRFTARGNLLLDTRYGDFAVGAHALLTYEDVEQVAILYNTARSQFVENERLWLVGTATNGLAGDCYIRHNVFEGGKLLVSTLTSPASGLLEGNLWISDRSSPFTWGGAVSGFPYSGSQDTTGHSLTTATRVFQGARDRQGSHVVHRAWPASRGAVVTPSWQTAGLYGDYEPAAELDLKGHTRPSSSRTTGAIE